MGEGKRKVILLVEDDLALLEALEIMLKDRYDVVKATNGMEAVKIYSRIKPDLVLTELVMPEMDGIKVTEEILRMDPNAKIVGITAYYLSKEKELMQAGAREVLEKPFTRKKLIEVIEKYLSS